VHAPSVFELGRVLTSLELTQTHTVNEHSHIRIRDGEKRKFVFGSSFVNVGFGFFIGGIVKMFPWWSPVMD